MSIPANYGAAKLLFDVLRVLETRLGGTADALPDRGDVWWLKREKFELQIKSFERTRGASRRFLVEVMFRGYLAMGDIWRFEVDDATKIPWEMFGTYLPEATEE